MTQLSKLPRSTPEAQGVASSAIIAFADAVDRDQLGVQSLMVVKNGHVVAEGWWKPYAEPLPHIMFSVSKSFTSTAIGLAVSEGRLSLDDPLVSFFPSYMTPAIQENMGAIQVRHLLTMSTGHANDTMGPMRESSDPDWARTFFSMPITHAPGTHFLYNSGASYMLSVILQSVTGSTLLDYLRPRLFHPLGILNPAWESCPRGYNLGASGLRIRTEDLAKFGQLYLQKGVWNGQRLLPESWVDEATKAQVSNGDNPDNDWNQGYGYQFWRCRHNAYRADGAFGQMCIVMPEHNTIVAITSGTRDMHRVFDAVWTHILPGLHEQALSADTQGNQAMHDRLASLALPVPQSLAYHPAVATEWADRTIQMEPNALHVRDITLTLNPIGTTFRAHDDKGTVHTIHCGHDDWVIGTSNLWFYDEPSLPVAVAARGGWDNEHTLVLTWQYIETPFRHIIMFDFSGDVVNVSIALDLPFWVESNQQVIGRLV